MQKHYRWNADLETEVRGCFDKKAKRRLSDLHYDVTKKMKGVCPNWMSKDVHSQMLKNAEDPDYKKKCIIAARNRRHGGDLESPVQPTHCQGSVSATERANKLVSVVIFLILFLYNFNT